MSDNFFSRWSRRKQGLESEAESNKPAQETSASPAARVDAQSTSSKTSGTAQDLPKAEPLPTLEDVQQLTPKSDFQSYMRQGVPGEVRNAAMKKLFTDPHFNVMDGLDIYIGDYNTPDPLPAGMLEKMVGAELLNLFTKTQENPDQRPDAPETPSVVAQSPNSQATSALPADTPLEHDHPDLQLQPNHAPASPDSGQSTG
jgi:hypothetical protein